MASSAYYVWSGGGKPFTLMRPARALQSKLQARGLTVYAYPNDEHLKANPPEDHTPFASTGWPGKSAFGIGHAIDIMPRTDNAAGRAENAALARKLIAARNAGVPGVLWIKYLNWTDEKGVCRQERWMSSHTTRSSTDKGHIHISGRTDCDNDARADGYDPLAIEGDIVPIELSNSVAIPSADAVPADWQVQNPPNESQQVGVILGYLYRREYLTVQGMIKTYDAVKALQSTPPVAVVQLSQAQLDQLRNDITALISSTLAAKIGTAVEQALAGAAGQAAIVTAVNTAEDS